MPSARLTRLALPRLPAQAATAAFNADTYISDASMSDLPLRRRNAAVENY